MLKHVATRVPESFVIPFIRLDRVAAGSIKRLLNDYKEESNFKPKPSQVIADLFISLGVDPEDITITMGEDALREAYGKDWKEIIKG